MITTDLESIVNDPEINIVIEVMGGIEPARTLILEAIKNRSLSSPQISPACNYGHELFNAADAAKVDLLRSTLPRFTYSFYARIIGRRSNHPCHGNC